MLGIRSSEAEYRANEDVYKRQGIYRVIRIKRDPAYKISNMPEKLQKKVMHMRGYRNRNIRIMTEDVYKRQLR